ncbi:hypothetical protein T4B_147 [Trichinella pseudospiralis]|uniref:Uncharacterized protein n=3 Tax=Trichinella pseudospiralis TaxID=6337 RepID=A0A0V1GW30_TRIPS|nr:hypothetical protein T4B_147 [Trichinella pseudospiralis]
MVIQGVVVIVSLGAGKAQRRRNMYAELEGLAESLSDDDHVEKADIFIDEMNVHIDVEEGADPSMKAVQWSEHPPGLFKMARRKHFTL